MNNLYANLYRWLLCLLVVLLNSCAKADLGSVVKPTPERYLSPRMEEFLSRQPESMREFYIEKHDAALKLINYLKLDGGRYYLDISESDAEKLGINRDIYASHLKDIENVNNDISYHKSRGSSIALIDPQKVMEKYKNPEFHCSIENVGRRNSMSRVLTSPVSGYLLTNGQEQATDVVKVDSNVSTFKCTFFPYVVIIASSFVRLTSEGGTVQDWKFYFLGCLNQDLEIPLPGYLGGSYLQITFWTTSGAGGKCVWCLE